MPLNRDRIVYDDQWFLGVHKLSGELTVAGKGKMNKLPLFDFLKQEFTGLHPLSRLDFETSGIVLFAKGRKTLAEVLNTKFEQWKKTYRTFLVGNLPKDKGEIHLPLPTREKGGEVEAYTAYKVLERFNGVTYVEATITTGRHHQIRKHFQMIGYPLVLDGLYGNAKFDNMFRQKFKFQRFFLHHASLEFPHPFTKVETRIEDKEPAYFEELLEKLRKGEK